MTEARPPLTVRIDRPRVLAARTREKRIVLFGGIVQVALGAVATIGVGFLAGQLASFSSEALGGSLFTLGFGGAVALGLVALGAVGLLSIRRKGADYWNAEGLPDIAFVVHDRGVSIHNPETGGVFEVPWAKLVAFDVKRLHVRFRFAPGTIDAKYHDQFWFGRATLDHDNETIRTALRTLSGREY